MNSRWPARAAVAALHLALLAGLWSHRPAPPPRQPAQRLTTLWLLPSQRAQPSPPPAAPLPQPPALPAAPRPLAPPDLILEANRPTRAPPAEATATGSAPTSPPATLPAEPPRTTLRLSLPPGYAASSAAARNPALSDPRSNTGRPTLEDRIATATGGAGAWVEENVPENRAEAVGAQGDHRSVFRRGDTCVEVFRSRITDTDPFNGNVAPRTVKMLGKPYKCK